jgi:hypothetical protein
MISSKPSRANLLTGRILSGLVVLFMALDGGAKLVRPEPVVEGTLELGFPEASILPLGIALLVSTALYALPRTAVLGAILLTGYLGGAVAAHVRVANPMFSHTLFPVYFGVLLWLGLWLRRPVLRNLCPIERADVEYRTY